ncbi:MAG: uracil-DNA glycosylase, partial [Candidatus Porifericomitaceae bacterium WSBS_2022_MAG_OTU9]
MPDCGGNAQTVPVEPVTVAVAGLDSLRQQVAACTACSLHKDRRQTVFGVGDSSSGWMIVGEAPGAEEDRLGEPFVGRAGQLLDAMLVAIGLSREQVYIANIIKCRPPKNRDPEPDEAQSCMNWLSRQIDLVQPQLILAVGRVAAQNLLRDQSAVGKLRGRRHTLPGSDVPVIVSYHPAYLLRNPQAKAEAWRDLLLAKSVFAEVSAP